MNWGPKSEIFRMFVEEMLFICDAIVRNGRWWKFRWGVWRWVRVPLASKADETLGQRWTSVGIEKFEPKTVKEY